MEIPKKWKGLYNTFVIFYLIFTFIVTIFSLHLFGGFYSFTNKSNSMNPSIDTGSITIVRAKNSYEVGDVIAYYVNVNNNAEIITHRIYRIGGNVYVTKGDANLGIDSPIILPRLIIGKVVLIIPYLGYIITFTKSPIGLVLTILIPATFIIVVELSKVMVELKGSKNHKVVQKELKHKSTEKK